MITQFVSGRKHWIIYPLVAVTAIGLSVAAGVKRRSNADSNSNVIARGGGTTMIQGGTGKTAGYTPILTTVAFHAENQGGGVTGAFECLARAPETSGGPGSAEFNTNAMYVTGKVETAEVNGDTATLTGTADITGLGAQSGVPFTFVIRDGGPGATAVLTTNGSKTLVFHEILLEGSFEVFSHDSQQQ